MVSGTELDGDVTASRDGGPPIAPAITERFRAWCLTNGHGLGTVEKSLRYLRFLSTEKGLQLDPAACTYDHVVEFLARWRQAGIKPKTLNSWVRELNLWSRFHSLGWRMNYFRGANPAPIRVPDLPLVRKLLTMRWANPSTHARNHLVLAILANTGIRRNELAHLDLADRIKLARGPGLRIRFAKGEQQRDVPIDPALSELLEEYVRTYRIRSDPVALLTTPNGRASYQYLGKIVKEAGAAVGAPWLSCHKLRHFMVDVSLDAGMPVSSVAEIVGHRRWATTQLYRQSRLQRIRAEADFRATLTSRAIFGANMRGKPRRVATGGANPDASSAERGGSRGI